MKSYEFVTAFSKAEATCEKAVQIVGEHSRQRAVTVCAVAAIILASPGQVSQSARQGVQPYGLLLDERNGCGGDHGRIDQ